MKKNIKNFDGDLIIDEFRKLIKFHNNMYIKFSQYAGESDTDKDIRYWIDTASTHLLAKTELEQSLYYIIETQKQNDRIKELITKN